MISTLYLVTKQRLIKQKYKSVNFAAVGLRNVFWSIFNHYMLEYAALFAAVKFGI